MAVKPGSKGQCVEKCNANAVPDMYEKTGKANAAIRSPRSSAIKLINTDSPMNCVTRECFSAPSTFLMPTSDDRFDERAVDKFIKLIHASRSVNNAMEPKTYKESMLPTLEMLVLNPGYKPWPA